jgi:type VII secretion protein EccE
MSTTAVENHPAARGGGSPAPPPPRPVQTEPERLPAVLPWPLRPPRRVAGIPVGLLVCWQAAVLMALAAIGRPTGVVIAVGAAAVLLVIVTGVRPRGRWLHESLLLWLRYQFRGQRVVDPRRPPAVTVLDMAAHVESVDHVEIDDDQVAVISHEHGYTTVLELKTENLSPYLPLTLAPRHDPDAPAVSIQLLVHATPVVPTTTVATVRSWLAVQVARDPSYQPEELRGALVNAVRRLQRRLRSARLDAQPLDRSRLAEALHTLTRLDLAGPLPPGTGSGQVGTEHWRAWWTRGIPQESIAVRSWPGSPAPPAKPLLELLLSPRWPQTLSVAGRRLRLSTSHGALQAGEEVLAVELVVRVSERDRSALDAAVRRLCDGLRAAGARVERLDGRQLPGLAATMPVGGFLSGYAPSASAFPAPPRRGMPRYESQPAPTSVWETGSRPAPPPPVGVAAAPPFPRIQDRAPVPRPTAPPVAPPPGRLPAPPPPAPVSPPPAPPPAPPVGRVPPPAPRSPAPPSGSAPPSVPPPPPASPPPLRPPQVPAAAPPSRATAPPPRPPLTPPPPPSSTPPAPPPPSTAPPPPRPPSTAPSSPAPVAPVRDSPSPVGQTPPAPPTTPEPIEMWPLFPARGKAGVPVRGQAEVPPEPEESSPVRGHATVSAADAATDAPAPADPSAIRGQAQVVQPPPTTPEPPSIPPRAPDLSGARTIGAHRAHEDEVTEARSNTSDITSDITGDMPTALRGVATPVAPPPPPPPVPASPPPPVPTQGPARPISPAPVDGHGVVGAAAYGAGLFRPEPRRRTKVEQLLALARTPHRSAQVVAIIAGESGLGASTTAAGMARILATVRDDYTALLSAADRRVDVGTVQEVTREHAFTVVDLGAHASAVAQHILSICTRVVVVISAEPDATQSIGPILDRVHRVKPLLAAGAVIAAVCKTGRQYRRVIRELAGDKGPQAMQIIPVPPDPALRTMDELDLTRLETSTREAYLRLAAAVAAPLPAAAGGARPAAVPPYPGG